MAIKKDNHRLETTDDIMTMKCVYASPEIMSGKRQVKMSFSGKMEMKILHYIINSEYSVFFSFFAFS